MSPKSDGSRPRGVAINVGANTSLPGIRGRLWPDGSFEYLPIPEREPTNEPVPTYGDLGCVVPPDLEDVPVHLDPSFAEYPGCDDYTYGDEHGIKAGPIGELVTNDSLWFYATLEAVDGGPPWAPPGWGAYIIGEFRLAVDPLDPAELDTVSTPIRERCRRNAHFRREAPDARVVVLGDGRRSRLLDRALPLSSASTGGEANAFVTELAGDSGAGPWWRRVLRFDAQATATLRRAIEADRSRPPASLTGSGGQR